jgi:GNAT superfamily N-acetyltransferase
MPGLSKASSDIGWSQASRLLRRVAAHLRELGCALWSEYQVSIEGLRANYALDELHFIADESDRVVGVVFLQISDPYFWPEITCPDMLFLHKLAIDPLYASNGYGAMAIGLIVAEAKRRGLQWIRLDCDDREPLHRFYASKGFQLVDIKMMGEYRVARYQLPLGDK